MVAGEPGAPGAGVHNPVEVARIQEPEPVTDRRGLMEGPIVAGTAHNLARVMISLALVSNPA